MRIELDARPLMTAFNLARRRIAYKRDKYICVALSDYFEPESIDTLQAYLGSLLGEVWDQGEPSWRLGDPSTRGGRLKRIGFLIMCERACRNES